MALCRKLTKWAFLAVLVVAFCLDLSIGHEDHHSGSCTSQAHESHDHHHHHHHQCEHGHNHHDHQEEKLATRSKLPEELAEEEDMKLYGFGFAHDHHDHGHNDHRHGTELSGLGI